MKKYQELIIDILSFEGEVEMLQASVEAEQGGDIFYFNDGWLSGGQNND